METVISKKKEDNHKEGINRIVEHLKNKATKEDFVHLFGELWENTENMSREELLKDVLDSIEENPKEIDWEYITDFFEIDNVRICSHCGMPMVVGVYADGDYYCSDECLEAGIGIDNYLTLSDENVFEDSQYFYTEWE